MWPIVNMPWAMIPGNPTRAGERVVLVQRVLVAAGVGVGLHVRRGDDARQLGQVVPDGDLSNDLIREPARSSWIAPCTRARPSSSNSSITIVTNPVAPLTRIDSIRGADRERSRPPGAAARRAYSCEPCTTRVKSRPRCGSPITCGNTSNSAAVTKVGGTPVGLAEDGAEGGHPCRVHDEGDLGVDGALGGRVHRAGTLGLARTRCQRACTRHRCRRTWRSPIVRSRTRWPVAARTYGLRILLSP